MRHIRMALAVGTLLASIAVHVATFFSEAHVQMGRFWPLHVLTMVAFGLGLWTWEKSRAKPRARPRLTSQEFFRAMAEQRELVRSLPGWVVAICAATMAYTMLNFLLFIVQMPGSPTQVGDAYSLVNRGQFLRTISYDEFRRFQNLETRGFSGHWILFSLLGVAALVLAPAQPPPRDSSR